MFLSETKERNFGDLELSTMLTFLLLTEESFTDFPVIESISFSFIFCIDILRVSFPSSMVLSSLTLKTISLS